jgi:hypothetical protein
LPQTGVGHVALTVGWRYAWRKRRDCASDRLMPSVDAKTRASMTTSFDKREEGFEKKFAHDEELRFKAYARRNKLLGLWAAGLLGKTGAEAEAYAKDVVMAEFEAAGDEDVFRKVMVDLAGKGITEQQVHAQMSELLAQAVAQISKSG